MKKKHFLVVGAGFSGAVLSRELVENINCHITIIDERSHIAGNCYTHRDKKSGIMIHEYGPHIFNTNREDVWDYVNRFGTFHQYINRVKAINRHGVFSMPVNLHTINQFFNKKFLPKEAEQFLLSLGDASIHEPRNFEEQALKMIGRELYEAFFYGYTKKQWGCEPTELPASILKRLPVRFSYDDNYYAAAFQGIPVNGYTQIVEKMIAHHNIDVQCGLSYDEAMLNEYDQIFYSGPIDRFFKYSEGRLGYRTVIFEKSEAEGDYQGNAVINYPETNVPYTRVHEHKHFTPWEKHKHTVYFHEYSKETGEKDIPYYPKRLDADMSKLLLYQNMAKACDKVSFIGRLGTYRYINMDQAIGEALDYSTIVIDRVRSESTIPVLSNEPV